MGEYDGQSGHPRSLLSDEGEFTLTRALVVSPAQDNYGVSKDWLTMQHSGAALRTGLVVSGKISLLRSS